MESARKHFVYKTDRLRPVLREAYEALGAFQRDRTAGNHRRVLLMLEEASPLLAFFRPFVPADKQGHFVAMAEPRLSVSDRIVAFDAAVAALQVDFTLNRAYLHKDSGKLRAVLRSVRDCESHAQAAAGEPSPDTLVTGVPVSPGAGAGEAFVPRWQSDCRRMPPGAVLVAPTAGPGLLDSMRLATAVVTDCGGPMCHASVLARELAVPCVVGTKEATRCVEPGWKIRVDGSTGAVARL